MEAFLCDSIRTPFGRYGGALRDVRPDELAAHVIAAVVDRNDLDPGIIDDVILGAANQAGEDNRNVGRMAALLAGLPVEVPGQTVNRLCGSGLQAVVTAAHAVAHGDGEVFVAGGQGVLSATALSRGHGLSVDWLNAEGRPVCHIRQAIE
mgnify:CR=1 FL=1